MKLLDLFCGAGGAAMGYFYAGFDDITGVDIAPQPHYPFRFVQADALDYLTAHGHDYDFIHASPPCQAYSRCQFLPQNADVKATYPTLIEPVRAQLKHLGTPYIIENVPGAPLLHPVWLNGPFFGLNVIRKRGFECSPWLLAPDLPKLPKKKHVAAISEFDRGQYGYISVYGDRFSVPVARAAMHIDWMTRKELAQAIPPAYTEYLGAQMLRIVTNLCKG